MTKNGCLRQKEKESGFGTTKWGKMIFSDRTRRNMQSDPKNDLKCIFQTEKERKWSWTHETTKTEFFRQKTEERGAGLTNWQNLNVSDKKEYAVGTTKWQKLIFSDRTRKNVQSDTQHEQKLVFQTWKERMRSWTYKKTKIDFFGQKKKECCVGLTNWTKSVLPDRRRMNVKSNPQNDQSWAFQTERERKWIRTHKMTKNGCLRQKEKEGGFGTTKWGKMIFSDRTRRNMQSDPKNDLKCIFQTEKERKWSWTHETTKTEFFRQKMEKRGAGLTNWQNLNVSDKKEYAVGTTKWQKMIFSDRTRKNVQSDTQHEQKWVFQTWKERMRSRTYKKTKIDFFGQKKKECCVGLTNWTKSVLPDRRRMNVKSNPQNDQSWAFQTERERKWIRTHKMTKNGCLRQKEKESGFGTTKWGKMIFSDRTRRNMQSDPKNDLKCIFQTEKERKWSWTHETTKTEFFRQKMEERGAGLTNWQNLNVSDKKEYAVGTTKWQKMIFSDRTRKNVQSDTQHEQKWVFQTWKERMRSRTYKKTKIDFFGQKKKEFCVGLTNWTKSVLPDRRRMNVKSDPQNDQSWAFQTERERKWIRTHKMTKNKFFRKKEKESGVRTTEWRKLNFFRQEDKESGVRPTNEKNWVFQTEQEGLRSWTLKMT